MSTAISNTKNLHILIFPFVSSGHIIPMLDLTHQLLTRGLTITVLVTPKNLSLLDPLLSAHPHSLHSLVLSPPLHDDPSKGSTVSLAKRLIFMMRGFSELRTPILEWFHSHPSPPTAIVSDFFLGWTHDLAREIGVPRVTFSPSGAFAISVSDFLWRNQPRKKSDSDDCLVSFDGIPNSPVCPWWQLSHTYRNFQEGDPDWEFFREGMLANSVSWGIVFNSFTELERVYIDHVKKEAGHDRVWAVGPLLPSSDDDSAITTQRGGSSSVPAHEVLTWLDQRPDCSVVYVCFGSRADLTRKQVAALAAGLESSGVHFVWCVGVTKGGEHVADDCDDAAILDGYEDRVANRGFVIRGWAPQVAILRHKAVGAFVTHCGWNSVLEGLSAGVVMLTWPSGADQFANAMLLVDQLGVGVRVGEETKKIPDSKELARILIESLDVTRPEKARAKELSAAALSAVKGGSSEIALDDLVKRLSEVKSQSKVVVKEVHEYVNGN